MKSKEPDAALTLVLRAVEFAARKHRDQRRKDVHASPYINHPIALAAVLSRVGGVRRPVVLAAALLHDALEDTRTTPAELRRHFGDRVAAIVREVTDDKRLPKARRKTLQIEHAASLSQEARLVKLADRICNLTDILETPPKGWPIGRRREYFDWSRQVIDQIRGTNAALEREFDRLYRRRP